MSFSALIYRQVHQASVGFLGAAFFGFVVTLVAFVFGGWWGYPLIYAVAAGIGIALVYMFDDFTHQLYLAARKSERIIPDGDWVIRYGTGKPCFLEEPQKWDTTLASLLNYLLPGLTLYSYVLQNRDHTLYLAATWAGLVVYYAASKMAAVWWFMWQVERGKRLPSGHRLRTHQGVSQILIEVAEDGEKWARNTEKRREELYRNKWRQLSTLEVLPVHAPSIFRLTLNRE